MEFRTLIRQTRQHRRKAAIAVGGSGGSGENSNRQQHADRPEQARRRVRHETGWINLQAG
jgi:hypothetical protein